MCQSPAGGTIGSLSGNFEGVGMEKWGLVAGPVELPLALPVFLLLVCQEVRTASLANVPAMMSFLPKAMVPSNVGRYLWDREP